MFQKSGIPELEKLAYSSAEYCMASDGNTVHYGLETDAYTHASSPIRRYADLVNQRILKDIIKDVDSVYILPIDYRLMNRRGKAVKRYGRDMDFLRAISTGENRFKAVIVDTKQVDNKKKIKLYVPKWKRTVSTCYYISQVDGSHPVIVSRDESRIIDDTLYREVDIECAFMPNARNWKERVVLNIL